MISWEYSLIIQFICISIIALIFLAGMVKTEKQLIKNQILEYLTEDKRGHCAIFDTKDGYAVWDKTTLFDVMNCVVKGLQKSQKLLNNKGAKKCKLSEYLLEKKPPKFSAN